MTTDYLSLLNKSGSGMNLTEVVTNLVDAEFTPRRDATQEKIDNAELSITAIGGVRAQFETMKTALSGLGDLSFYQAGTSSPSVAIEVTDPSVVVEGSSEINVTQIAQRQVLEFTGFTGGDQILDSGEMTVEFGEWSDGNSPSFTVDPERDVQFLSIGADATLDDFASALNEIEGISAKVLNKGDGTFSLGITTEIGAKNAFRMAEPKKGNLEYFDMTQKISDVQVSAASDAAFSVDGLTVYRPTNTVTDLIDGVSLTLFAATDGPADIVVASDIQSVQSSLETLVENINSMTGLLRTETARGLEGGAAGALSGDRIAQDLLAELSSLTTKPIGGFGDDPVYLSQLGFETQRDGNVFLNVAKFTSVFEADPLIFDAVFTDGFSTDTSGVEIRGVALSSTKAGSYDFNYDPDTGTATLDGKTLEGTTLEDGRVYFYSGNDDTRGMSITIDPGVTNAKVRYGESLNTALTNRVQDVLSSTGDLARREDYFGSRIEDANDMLTELDAKAETMQSRYQKKFSAMEQIVSQLNGTGAYITNLIDSWNAAKD